MKIASGAFCALFTLLAAGGAQAQTRYTLTPLGAFGTTSQANAINNRGQVVGFITRPTTQGGKTSAFLYSKGPLADLGNFGGSNVGTGYATANAINYSGQIAGWSEAYDAGNNPLGSRGFFYANGTLTDLGAFGTNAKGYSDSTATGINDSGVIAGYSDVFDANLEYQTNNAFLYANGVLTNIGGLGTNFKGYAFSIANAINNSGQVVGFSDVYDASHTRLAEAAFLYSNGTMIALGNLGTDQYGSYECHANAVNNLGLAVGDAKLYDSSHYDYGSRAALFYPDGRAVDLSANNPLGVGAGNTSTSQAFGINDRGQIVGLADVYDSKGSYTGQSAFLYQNGVMNDLNLLIPPNSGWRLTNATGINGRGQICGYGMHDNIKEGFLLTPLPAGDFNADGSSDLVWRNTSTNTVLLGLMSGLKRGADQTVASGISAEWRIAATPDLNGGGSSGIVWQNTVTGDVAYWILNAGQFVGSVPLAAAVPLDWQIVGSGDFNGDGKPDLLWQSQSTGAVAVWYLDGTKYVGSVPITAGVGTQWRVAGLGDFNGDGNPDLLWRNSQTGDLYVWFLDGSAKYAGNAALASAVPLNYRLAGVGDYNGDGNPDLVWQDSTSGDVYVWLLNGTTYIGNAPVSVGAGTTWQVVGPK